MNTKLTTKNGSNDQVFLLNFLSIQQQQQQKNLRPIDNKSKNDFLEKRNKRGDTFFQIETIRKGSFV